MLNVLNSYDVITARESGTYNALKEHHIRGELRLERDAAFGLAPEPVRLPGGLAPKSYIALNLSPLIIRREPAPGMVPENFRRLVARILTDAGMSIALLPHVVMPSDNDEDALTELRNSMPAESRSRMRVVDGKLNAARLKYIISQARALVCCRTHASIAAYSTGVPCLTVGYSIKSAGIAEDLGLGGFVVRVERLTVPSVLETEYRKLSLTKGNHNV
jgi:polysaccharide pyruvyl transferase WcaK-like protein